MVLPLPGWWLHEPGRPHADHRSDGRGGRFRGGALRQRELSELPGRLLHGAPGHRRPAGRLRRLPRRLHLREPWLRAGQKQLADEVTTLETYRNRYALYKADADLQAAHASCPWYVTWDDHEVENNYAGLVPQNPADESTFAERRRAAYQVWWEHQPVALAAPDSDADDYTIYRSARWGDLVDLVLLDGRQYRTDQACGDPGLSLDPPCPETFDESRTMLGDVQEAWLLDTLGAASATWQVLAQQTIFGDVTLGGAVLNYDQWDGYPVERNRIVDALDPARNTVVLTGDIHFAGAGNIRQGGRGTGTPVAAEFVATSISSGGLVDPAVTEVVRAIPDIVDVELEHRGYILHTVTPDRWSAEYRMVETVKEPGAPMFVHATYVIDAGTNTARFA